MELRNILSARLSLPLPATLAFNHPTVGEFERLSEEEAEALLARKLDKQENGA